MTSPEAGGTQHNAAELALPSGIKSTLGMAFEGVKHFFDGIPGGNIYHGAYLGASLNATSHDEGDNAGGHPTMDLPRITALSNDHEYTPWGGRA